MTRSMHYLGLAMLVALAPFSKANLILNGNFSLTNNGYSETQAPEDWTNIGAAVRWSDCELSLEYAFL